MMFFDVDYESDPETVAVSKTVAVSVLLVDALSNVLLCKL